MTDGAKNDGESAVLRIFRSYRVTPNQMLFLNGEVDQRLRASMTRLIEKGFIVRDKPKHAYYLTNTGYEAVLALPRSGDTFEKHSMVKG